MNLEFLIFFVILILFDLGKRNKSLLKIDTYLNEVGSQKGNILSANIWLSSIKDFDSMNKIWDEWVDSENPPVRACVESKLASEKFIVEISIIAKL